VKPIDEPSLREVALNQKAVLISYKIFKIRFWSVRKRKITPIELEVLTGQDSVRVEILTPML